MRVHRINCASTKWKKSRRCKIEILRWWSRREWIRLVRSHEGLRHIERVGRRIGCHRAEALQIGKPEEWRLTVELQIVFSFENVVEDSEAASDAHLSAGSWRPCKAETRCPIVLVGKV